jgi:integrase/recombinase XerD
MYMKQKESLAGKEEAASFARQLGLPELFQELHISGIEKLMGAEGVSPRNKELIFRFLNHISPEVSEERLTFYTHKLRKVSCWLRKDFDLATEEDLRSLVTFLSRGQARDNGGTYSFATVHGYKVTLKRFYRWLEGGDEEYPRKVRWIKTSGDTTRIKEPEQLLSFEEVLEMIRHARCPRDKAIVSFLYESGARISEMLSMKIRHVEFSGNMVKATFPVSKTQTRVIPLVSCRSHLCTWMNYHPLKNDPEAPLWSNLKGEGRDPLISSTVNDILKRLAHDSGITKRVYPHLFRACSITNKQEAGWPEQGVKLFHGLCKDSKAMKHYSHLSYGNLERIQKKMNGIPVDDAATPSKGTKCAGCGRYNPLYVETCACGLPTEMKFVPGNPVHLESDMEARLERKMREFVESRQVYDRVMERFMNALLERATHSPDLLKVVSEIGRQLGEQGLQMAPQSASNPNGRKPQLIPDAR